MSVQNQIGGRITAVAVAVVFMAALLAHAGMVHTFGVEVPFGDQWAAEGLYLLKPWADGRLTFMQLFSPWNEHRIFFSRIISISLYESSHQTWSIMRAMYVNALLYACIPALLTAFVGRSDASRAQKAIMATAILIMSLLWYGWENTIGAFQNPFYLLVLSAITGIGMAAFCRPRLINFLILTFIAFISIFTLAAGSATAPAIAFVLLIRAWLGHVPKARAMVSIGSLLVTAIFGYAITPTIPAQAALHAQSTRELIHATWLVAGWPTSSPRVGAFILWIPSIIGAWMIFRRRWAGKLDALMMGLAAWTAVQVIGIALSRGHGMTFITPRYTDILVIGVLANLWFAVRLSGSGASAVPMSRALFRRAPIFLLTLVVTEGLLASVASTRSELDIRRNQLLMQQAHVQAYLKTHVPAELDQPVPAVALPEHDWLRAILDDSKIDAMLVKRQPERSSQNGTSAH